ncbi:uncharacterized protein UDID_08139 [Ustilago sp. UG-2017a]|nr:uncharacterized protein UDID_08139 [Ustilago sp. UG-2017a]
MKLSGMFRIGFVAAIVTALILLPSCIASGTDEASTSTTHPSVKTYMDHLNTEKISTLPSLERFVQGESDLYDAVPFIHTGSRQQYVGIVDVSKNDARLINFIKDPNGDRLEQTVFRDGPSKAIRLFQLHPDLHRIRTFAYGARSDIPHLESIEDLAYANGRPILSEESETLGHMISAARDTPGEFYYFQNGKPLILVTPSTVEQFQDTREAEVHRTYTEYLADKEKYGKTIASLTRGNPIIATDDPLGQRKSGRGLINFARFDNQATREQMVTELQRYGRLRVHQQIDGKKYRYKVKVSNPGATEGQRLKVYVKPLSFIERSQEKIMAPFLKFQIPLMTELRVSH